MFLFREGPTHIGIMISPVKNVALESWSFEGTKPLAGPKWQGRDTYFVYYAYGQTPTPLEFSLDFKVSGLLLLLGFVGWTNSGWFAF